MRSLVDAFGPYVASSNDVACVLLGYNDVLSIREHVPPFPGPAPAFLQRESKLRILLLVQQLRRFGFRRILFFKLDFSTLSLLGPDAVKQQSQEIVWRQAFNNSLDEIARASNNTVYATVLGSAAWFAGLVRTHGAGDGWHFREDGEIGIADMISDQVSQMFPSDRIVVLSDSTLDNAEGGRAQRQIRQRRSRSNVRILALGGADTGTWALLLVHLRDGWWKLSPRSLWEMLGDETSHAYLRTCLGWRNWGLCAYNVAAVVVTNDAGSIWGTDRLTHREMEPHAAALRRVSSAIEELFHELWARADTEHTQLLQSGYLPPYEVLLAQPATSQSSRG